MTSEPTEECFTFASFRLFPQQRSLWRGSDLVPIGGRAFDVLLMLVSRAGTVVSLNELMEFVWPSVTVEEANLRVQMGMLRKILSQCDDARRAIETIPLRGYCFILPVRHELASAEGTVTPNLASALLPPILTPIVGRDEAIDLLCAAMADRRLISITGPGGIGKTMVAIATARRYAASMSGAVAFIDLSQACNGHEAAAIIAQALGIEAAVISAAILCDQIRDLQALLVLDTCEHIVDDIAALSEMLLARCPALKLLVTSREALRAGGEWTHRLASLTVPDAGEALTSANIGDYSAVLLFLERAGSSANFILQAQDLESVAEICRRLDGIPLALEFAAARMSDLGLREITARLDDCFSILTRGRRTALPRHRSLSAALDWSYGLLSEIEQKSLRRLAMIPGAFSVEDGIAQCEEAGCERPPEALSSLYEKSLLSVDHRSDVPSYRLLATTKAFVMATHAA